MLKYQILQMHEKITVYFLKEHRKDCIHRSETHRYVRLYLGDMVNLDDLCSAACC